MQPHAHTAFPAQEVAPVHLDTAGEVWALVISPEISWDAARAHIADDLACQANALHGRSLRLNLGARPLDLMEVRRIATLLRDGFKAAIIGLESTPDAVHRYAETAFKMPMIAPPIDTRPRMPLVFTGAPFAVIEDARGDAGVDEAVPTDLPNFDDAAIEEIAGSAYLDGLEAGLEEADQLLDIENTDIIELCATLPAEAGRRVMVLEKTLRSGKTIRFAGDVMVYGDVNSGAHIEADGNIIVFGSLRGLAHAGARGDSRAVIISFDLGAPQLRISDHIGFISETPEITEPMTEPQGFAKVRGDVVGGLTSLLGRGRLAPRTFNPEIAWVEAGEIRIGSYQGRLPA